MNRVWIELEPSEDEAMCRERAEACRRMLLRLGVEESAGIPAVFWDQRRECYCFAQGGGYFEGVDNGHWYNLDFLGRDFLGRE